MSDATPGRWHWWTSNSWRRLMSEQDGGRRTVPVLQPVVALDGHPDLSVSEADMGVIAASRDMHDVLEELEDSFDRQTYEERMREELDIQNDREFSVSITYKQMRAIGIALTKAREKP